MFFPSTSPMAGEAEVLCGARSESMPHRLLTASLTMSRTHDLHKSLPQR